MQPKGEKIRRAIKWVNEMKNHSPDKALLTIVNEANMKFDMNPADSQFLINFFKSEGKESADDEA